MDESEPLLVQAHSDNASQASSIKDGILQVSDTQESLYKRGMSWKKNCCICTLTLVILVGIALTVFFVHYAKERPVDFKLGGYAIVKDKVQFGRWGLEAPIDITIVTDNGNYFDITLFDMKLTGRNPLYQGDLITGYKPFMILPKRSSGVPHNITVTMRYAFDQDPDAAFINSVKTNCSSEVNSGIFIDTSIVSRYKVLVKEGTRRENKQFTLPCDTLMAATGL